MYKNNCMYFDKLPENSDSNSTRTDFIHLYLWLYVRRVISEELTQA